MSCNSGSPLQPFSTCLNCSGMPNLQKLETWRHCVGPAHADHSSCGLAEARLQCSQGADRRQWRGKCRRRGKCPGCRPSARTQSSPRGSAGTAAQYGGVKRVSRSCGHCKSLLSRVMEAGRGALLSFRPRRSRRRHLGVDGAAAGHDAGDALGCEVDVAQQHTGMDREVVDALVLQGERCSQPKPAENQKVKKGRIPRRVLLRAGSCDREAAAWGTCSACSIRVSRKSSQVMFSTSPPAFSRHWYMGTAPQKGRCDRRARTTGTLDRKLSIAAPMTKLCCSADDMKSTSPRETVQPRWSEQQGLHSVHLCPLARASCA